MEWKVRREIFEGEQYGYSQVVYLADARASPNSELLCYRNNTLIRTRHVPANASDWNKRFFNSDGVATSAEMIESGLIDLLEQVKKVDALFFSLVVPRVSDEACYTLVGENKVYATPLNEYERYILRRLAPGKIKGETSRLSDLWFAFKYLKDDFLVKRTK